MANHNLDLNKLLTVENFGIVQCLFQENLISHPNFNTLASAGQTDIMNMLIEKQLTKVTDFGNLNADAHLDTIKILFEKNVITLAPFSQLYDNLKIFKMCLEAKIIINIDLPFGFHNRTSLLHCARNDRFDDVKMLLDYGANIDFQDDCGDTAFILAAYFGNGFIVQLLINAKANIGLKDNSEKDALYYAKNYGKPNIVKMIKKALNATNIVGTLKNTDGKVYPELIPKSSICHAIYRVNDNEIIPPTKLVKIAVPNATIKLWTENDWVDTMVNTKDYQIQVSIDNQKIEYHTMIIDSVERYVKFPADLMVGTNQLGDIY